MKNFAVYVTYSKPWAKASVYNTVEQFIKMLINYSKKKYFIPFHHLFENFYYNWFLLTSASDSCQK